MKKLFSMAVIFIMALTLAGCSTNEEVLDNELSFTFINEYDESSTKTITYEDGYSGELKDLIVSNFDFDYIDSEYGTLLISIEHLNPKEGAYISISKNGVMSDVGLDLMEFEAGDSFEFNVTWWDSLQESIDDVIQLFLDNHASDYVNSDSVDYNVLLGLNLLNIVSDYVTVDDVETIVSDKTLSYVQDYFKAIMMLNSVGSNSEPLITDLNSIITPGSYGQTAYGLLAMDSVINTEDYSSYVTAALADLETTTPFDLGLDAGGISIVALSNYTGVEALINDYTSWISTSQLESGGVVTRDVVWGDTTYPGTENASSISQVILGLIANGIDPTGIEFTKGTNNLITRLLEFTTDTGSFDYVEGDEATEDLAFSTPQAFLALVSYQIFANTYSSVNPYDFK